MVESLRRGKSGNGSVPGRGLRAIAAVLLLSTAVAPREARAAVVFQDSTGTVTNQNNTIGGSSYSSDWFVPSTPALGFMLMEHGFSRGCGNIRDTGLAIMRQGLVVLCINASMQGGNPSFGVTVGDAIADGTLVPPAGTVVPAATIVGGHSAGGHFATEVGKRLVQRGFATLKGAILFDPVSAGGFADNVLLISAGATRPVLSVTANSSSCNSSNNSASALAGLPNSFVGLKLTNGSLHTDVEGTNSDFLGTLACGTPQAANTTALRTLAAAWAGDIVRGTRTSAYYEYGTYTSGLISQNRATPIKALPDCGNGSLNAGEACDLGAESNGADGACCALDCSFAAATTVCRAAAGACDVAEACTGASDACPADGFADAGVACRAANGACDVDEACTGTSAACPTDGFVVAGTTCRAATGDCDVAESCTGSSASCPADGFLAAGTTCRVASDACDAPEACTGTSAGCPVDQFVAAGTSCRAATAACDVAEACTGSSAACPADGVAGAGTACRAASGTCDAAEICDGSGKDCPANGFAAAGTVCRAATGPCDVAEVCSGASNTCPADGLATSGTTCRAAAGPCDLAEACTGSSAACPGDVRQPAGVTCRPASDACDIAESCTGSSPACPADVYRPAGTPCRPAAGVCDAIDACTGSSAACPADGKKTSVCRTASDVCDAPESCDGVADDCPTDLVASAGAVCREVGDACDVAESCDGSSKACPTDTGLPDADQDGTCDAEDTCPASADPLQADADGDGRGDACDECTVMPGGAIAKTALKLSGFGTPAGDDKVTFKGEAFMPTNPALDPATHGVRVLVYDETAHMWGSAAIADLSVPSGAWSAATGSGWVASTSGWTWKAPRLPTGKAGVAKVSLRRIAAGRWSFSITTKDSSFDLPATGGPLVAAVVFAPPGAAVGSCAEIRPACKWDTLLRSVSCR
ncbi:hypothetical protein KGQ64_11250 [bacterium]|nr:hypothetical protein [bacterium]